MLILALETSCDETAAAIVEDGRVVRSSVISSSRDAFTAAGGVIPEEAARMQLECVLPVLEQALSNADLTPKNLDAIAVTRGPGLLGSLLVGTVTSRVLSALWMKRLIGVHHTLGHLSSTWLESEAPPQFPILTLSASGGHTELWYRTKHTEGILLGHTRDDAAGEAFDKGASLLGLPYPGGPAIADRAKGGNRHAFTFPLPLLKEETTDFSFSGLKTALRYTVRDLTPPLPVSDLAASYEHALCRHLIDRIAIAWRRYPDARELHLVGGVSANTHLRTLARELCGGRTLRFPARPSYCTDNAAMIAAAAAFMLRERGERAYAPFETHASLALASAVGYDER